MQDVDSLMDHWAASAGGSFWIEWACSCPNPLVVPPQLQWPCCSCILKNEIYSYSNRRKKAKKKKRKKKVAYSHGSKTAHKGDLGHLFRWARVCRQILYQKVTCLYFDLCKMNILFQSYFCIQDHREWFFRHSTNEDQSKNRLSSMQFWLKNQWQSQGQLKTLLVFKVSFHSKSSLKTQRSYALFQKHEIML